MNYTKKKNTGGGGGGNPGLCCCQLGSPVVLTIINLPISIATFFFVDELKCLKLIFVSLCLSIVPSIFSTHNCMSFKHYLPSLCSPVVAVADPTQNIVDEAWMPVVFRSCSCVILATG